MAVNLSVQLANGSKMPVVGLGTWLAASGDEAQFAAAVESALDAGYRHFDTAFAYGNELVLGRVLTQWIASGRGTREELFVVTKLPICGMKADKVSHFMTLSLQNLGLDYVDLYLVHVPFGVKYSRDDELIPFTPQGLVDLDMNTDLATVWCAMEAEVDAGRAKAIGVSNFEEVQLERLLATARIKPSNLQIECHAYFQQRVLRAFCARHGIVVSAYAPFASPGRGEFYDAVGLKFEPVNLAEDSVVRTVAAAHGRTPHQILLRFLTQLSVVVLPKSVNVERMKANLHIFDYQLSTTEMKQLEGLDKGPTGRTFRFEFLPG